MFTGATLCLWNARGMSVVAHAHPIMFFGQRCWCSCMLAPPPLFSAMPRCLGASPPLRLHNTSVHLYNHALQVHALLLTSFPKASLDRFPLLAHQWPLVQKFRWAGNSTGLAWAARISSWWAVGDCADLLAERWWKDCQVSTQLLYTGALCAEAAAVYTLRSCPSISTGAPAFMPSALVISLPSPCTCAHAQVAHEHAPPCSLHSTPIHA